MILPNLAHGHSLNESVFLPPIQDTFWNAQAQLTQTRQETFAPTLMKLYIQGDTVKVVNGDKHKIPSTSCGIKKNTTKSKQTTFSIKVFQNGIVGSDFTIEDFHYGQNNNRINKVTRWSHWSVVK
jgi:hypothetical protein